MSLLSDLARHLYQTGIGIGMGSSIAREHHQHQLIACLEMTVERTGSEAGFGKNLSYLETCTTAAVEQSIGGVEDEAALSRPVCNI